MLVCYGYGVDVVWLVEVVDQQLQCFGVYVVMMCCCVICGSICFCILGIVFFIDQIGDFFEFSVVGGGLLFWWVCVLMVLLV